MPDLCCLRRFGTSALKTWRGTPSGYEQVLRGSFAAASVLDDIEIEHLRLNDGREPGAFNGGDADEHVELCR